jgi:peptidoglycan/LPS O-acetylase OafA/YrhL
LIHNRELVGPRVIFLGALGLQSIDPNIALIINAPLWSLSVELMMSFLLYWIIQLRSHQTLIWFVVIYGFIAWNLIPSSPVLLALPCFTIGVAMRIQNLEDFYISPRLASFVISILCVYYIFVGATNLLALSNSTLGLISKLFLISSLLLLISKIRFSPRISRICSSLGERAFVIYAFHYPVLLASKEICSEVNNTTPFIFVAMSVFGTFILAELAFRVIDRPWTTISKRM